MTRLAACLAISIAIAAEAKVVPEKDVRRKDVFLIVTGADASTQCNGLYKLDSDNIHHPTYARLTYDGNFANNLIYWNNGKWWMSRNNNIYYYRKHLVGGDWILGDSELNATYVPAVACQAPDGYCPSIRVATKNRTLAGNYKVRIERDTDYSQHLLYKHVSKNNWMYWSGSKEWKIATKVQDIVTGDFDARGASDAEEPYLGTWRITKSEHDDAARGSDIQVLCDAPLACSKLRVSATGNWGGNYTLTLIQQHQSSQKMVYRHLWNTNYIMYWSKLQNAWIMSWVNDMKKQLAIAHGAYGQREPMGDRTRWSGADSVECVDGLTDNV